MVIGIGDIHAFCIGRQSQRCCIRLCPSPFCFNEVDSPLADQRREPAVFQPAQRIVSASTKRAYLPCADKPLGCASAFSGYFSIDDVFLPLPAITLTVFSPFVAPDLVQPGHGDGDMLVSG